MITLELENFQIHKNNKFTFKPGLTVILGQGCSGKTSILRSLETLISNPPKTELDTFINHSAKSMQIKLSFDDINKEYIYKKDYEVEYFINGKHYTKLNRANIFKLDLDFPFVEDEKNNILNIQGEWDFTFPFTRKDSELFKLFEDIFSIFDSTLIIKQFNSSMLNIKKEINIANETNYKNEVIIKELNDFNSTSFSPKNIINYYNVRKYLNSIKIIPEYKFDIINNFSFNSFLDILNIKYKNLFYNNFNLITFELNSLSSKLLDLLKIKSNIKYNSFDIFNYNLLSKYNSFLELNKIKFKKIENKKFEIKKFAFDNIQNIELINNSFNNLNQIKNLNLEIDSLKQKHNELKNKYDQLIKICPTCNRPL